MTLLDQIDLAYENGQIDQAKMLQRRLNAEEQAKKVRGTAYPVHPKSEPHWFDKMAI